MKIYLLRHGQAEPFIDNDAQRSLTDKGIADVKALGRLLQNDGVTFDAAFVSPYLRTQQTFQTLSDQMAYGGEKFDCEALLSESNSLQALEFFHDLIDTKATGSMIWVTHQPLISSLIATLVDGTSRTAYDYPMMPASLAVIDTQMLLPNMGQLVMTKHAPYE